MTREQDARGFAERLRAAMHQNGLVSKSARSGVDVNALAEVAHTTYEMARRYAEGVAIPRPEKLAAIAAWLRVSPGLLLWGEQKGTVDTHRLELCIRAIQEAQARTGVTLTTERAARLVAILYEEAAQGRPASPQALDLMIRAAT